MQSIFPACSNRLLLLGLLFGLSFLPLFAQTLTEASPESVGMSTERLQRIESVVQDYVNQQRIAGAVALVVRNGKIVYYKGIGYDDMDTKSPLKRDAIFRIASQTKAITSTAVMMLYEEGKLLLDDPVSKYIPSFKEPKVLATFNEKDTTFTTVPAKREITIRDLLTHTSGISYAGIGTKEATAIYAKYKIPSGIGTPNYKLADAITLLGTMPLVHQPGEKFSYGLNTDVLGYVVEVVSGKTLDEFFRQRIFEPLGMKDTYFYLPSDKAGRLTTLYTQNREGATIKSVARNGSTPDFPKQKGTFYSGGAGLSSTAYDYAIFLQSMLNGGQYGSKRILGPITIDMMTANQIGDLNVGARKFGLGYAVATEKEAARIPVSVGTYEWGGIFGTTYWADPKEGIVALIMTQKYPNSYGDLSDKFKVLVYQAITKKNP
ncbi:serine hydrolase [Telluribacter sp. SYSU D00476]|uniref:serine hydrolase domain-containing protein n=1 Tax=Telluribacter sp. SYSU D00476 TaxID=2811430 RepID=UPI001FF348EE|nr:serine hydrolase domain-containing protein [Telluribacter sp. SYSU D00476]